MLGSIVTGLAVVGLLGIGVAALLAPGRAAREYGIEVEDPRAAALFRAMGVRDLSLGITLALLAASGRSDLLAWGLAGTALVACVDFAVVTADRPSRPVDRTRARALHGLGLLGMFAAAAIVAMGH